MPRDITFVRRGRMGECFDDFSSVKMQKVEKEVNAVVDRKGSVQEIVEKINNDYDLTDEEWTTFCYSLGYMCARMGL